jgi:hypothetical protein
MMIPAILIGLIGGIAGWKKWTPMFRQRDQDGGVKMERVPNGHYTKEFREEASLF